MLELIVPGMVTQILDGNPGLQPQAREPEPPLDDALPRAERAGDTTAAADDVDVLPGEQIELPDQLLGVDGGEARRREAEAARVRRGGRRGCDQGEEDEGGEDQGNELQPLHLFPSTERSSPILLLEATIRSNEEMIFFFFLFFLLPSRVPES